MTRDFAVSSFRQDYFLCTIYRYNFITIYHNCNILRHHSNIIKKYLNGFYIFYSNLIIK